MIGQFRRAPRGRLAAMLAGLAALLVPLAGSAPAAVAQPGRPAIGAVAAAVAQPWPDCPQGREYCHVDIHFDSFLYCASFTAGFGSCVGKSNGNPAFTNGAFAEDAATWTAFGWTGSGRRLVEYQVLVLGVPIAVVTGQVPGPGSADFSVESAYSTLPEPGHWVTPNLPGVRAGQPGGPLYLDFESGSIGADVYIRGYLLRR
jgi:hypothetical protein